MQGKHPPSLLPHVISPAHLVHFGGKMTYLQPPPPCLESSSRFSSFLSVLWSPNQLSCLPSALCCIHSYTELNQQGQPIVGSWQILERRCLISEPDPCPDPHGNFKWAGPLTCIFWSPLYRLLFCLLFQTMAPQNLFTPVFYLQASEPREKNK